MSAGAVGQPPRRERQQEPVQPVQPGYTPAEPVVNEQVVQPGYTQGYAPNYVPANRTTRVEDNTRGDTADTAGVLLARDRVRWGPVWAGLITTLPSFLVMVLLAYGIGLGYASNAVNAWVTGILALIAFFFGGWVAGRTSGVRGTGAGLMLGFLVWALGTTLILLLSLVGLGSIFGAMSQFFAAGGSTGTSGINVSAAQIAHTARTAAWGGFISLVVAAIAAMIGGWLGALGGPLGRLARRR